MVRYIGVDSLDKNRVKYLEKYVFTNGVAVPIDNIIILKKIICLSKPFTSFMFLIISFILSIIFMFTS